jgi:hypothetical protein
VEHLNGSPEVMAYSSINAAGSALVWNYGPTAQSLVIGCTLEDKNAGPANGPLNWNELSSDLIVASHFSSTVGIYSLEGCIRQGFLPRLASFDWGQTVTVSADAMKQAQQFRQRVGLAIWIISRLPYFLAAALLLVLYLLYRLRLRRREKKRLAQIAQGGQMT